MTMERVDSLHVLEEDHQVLGWLGAGMIVEFEQLEKHGAVQ